MEIELLKREEGKDGEKVRITFTDDQTKFLVQYAVQALLANGYFHALGNMKEQLGDFDDEEEEDDQISDLPDSAFFKA